MNGREEADAKIFNKLECETKWDLPSYVREWYLHLRANHCTAITCQDYLRKVRDYLYSVRPYEIEEIPRESITAESVESYLLGKQYKYDKDGNVVKTSNSYQSSIYFCMNNFLEFMAKRKYIPCNYIKEYDIKNTKNKDKVERIHLTKDDFHKIIEKSMENSDFDAGKAREAAILLLLMITGMRRGALCSINLSDFEIEDNKIVGKTLSVTDKGEKTHDYILTRQTIKALNNWLEHREFYADNITTDALFINHSGTRLSNKMVGDIVKQACYNGIGKELSPHKLRAGFITIMIEETGDIMATCEAVGHASVRTTQRYYATNGRGKKMAADIMKDL